MAALESLCLRWRVQHPHLCTLVATRPCPFSGSLRVRSLVPSHLECPSSLTSADSLCRKLEDLQQFQKREPETEEEVDVLNLSEPLKVRIKKEQEEKQEEMKFYLPPTPGSEFIGDVTQKVRGSGSPWR